MSETECRCRIVGWERDPYEPHIPAQATYEQADDCPVHTPAPRRLEPRGEADPTIVRRTVRDRVLWGLIAAAILNSLGILGLSFALAWTATR